MYIELTENDFIDLFKEMNREDQFSYEAKQALFKYYNDFEEETGEKVNCDIIALCCEWSEFENFEELLDCYDSLESLEELRNLTTVIELDNGGLLIIQY